MAEIQINSLSKSFGKSKVIKDISLSIQSRSFTVIVGPSGCGKSTLLRMIAGLEKIDTGEIRIAGKSVNDLPPKDREIAMVFQSYALYPHMTVRKNIAFPLRMAGLSSTEQGKKVEDAAKVLNLSEYLDRKPGQLSGGQRQRVAIGRAIVREPQAFLFDEPLSNLDAALRVGMRVEISELHKRLATTMIYVTHDQIEAMTMADKIVVLQNGKIEQVGTPLDLYRFPLNIFVAGFIGSPKMNIIEGPQASKYKSASIGIRPEHIFFKKEHAVRISKDDNFAEIQVTPELNEYVGHEQIITFNYQGQEILGKFSSSIKVESGKEITLYVDLNNICFFDQAQNSI